MNDNIPSFLFAPWWQRENSFLISNWKNVRSDFSFARVPNSQGWRIGKIFLSTSIKKSMSPTPLNFKIDDTKTWVFYYAKFNLSALFSVCFKVRSNTSHHPVLRRQVEQIEHDEWVWWTERNTAFTHTGLENIAGSTLDKWDVFVHLHKYSRSI